MNHAGEEEASSSVAFFRNFNGFFRLVALKQNGPQIDQGRNVGRLEVQQSPVQLFRGGIAFFGEGFCGALPQGFRLQLPAYRGFHAPVQRFSWSGVMVPAEMAARRACSAERLFSSSICRVSSST